MNDRPLPTLRDQAILFPITLPNSLLWIGLTALAYLGNVANLSLSVNVDLIWGTIPVLIILHFFGWVPATLSAVVASVHTAVLWSHPYGILIFTAETLIVGTVYRRRSGNLLLLDTTYWILVGMPLTAVIYRAVLGVASTTSFLLTFRMAVNGVFNALVASLLIALVEQIAPRLRHSTERRILGFAQAIFLVMVAFVLIPAMGILVFTTRQEMSRVEQDVQTRLSITTFSARQAVNAWMAENLQTLRSLASVAAQAGPGDANRLSTEMRLLNMSDADFRVLGVSDVQGTVIAAEPHDAAVLLLSGADLAQEQFFDRMITDLQGVASDVVFRSQSAATPIVLFGVPIVAGDQISGAVIGVLDTGRLSDLLSRVSGNWDVEATITDGNGVIITSTDPEVPPFGSYEREFPGPYERVSPSVNLRVAQGFPRAPEMQRWQFTEFSTRARLGITSRWSISLSAALAPHQNELIERYRSLFLVMVVVIVVTTLLSALVSRQMLGSLTALTAVAEDLPEKVVRREEPRWPVSRIDEIHTLIQCFKITSEHLGESFTRLQEANAQLLDAKQQAESANRTKSEFLANISHDLRTPLNGILGYAQILSRDTSLDEQTRNAVSIIRKSGNHLLNLINDILDVSRIEADKLHLESAPFFLRSFLDDIADIVSLHARQKGLQFIVDLSDDLPLVASGDEKRLRQVLLNLLNNAVKFTEHGHVRFTARIRGEVLHVEVEDTGIGIPIEEQDAIFSPFKQLTKHIQSEEGTGLGLAIVQRLVAMMNGTVSVVSRPGEGSRFTVELALPAADAVPPGPQSMSTVTGYRGRIKTILAVDDKEQNRSVLRNMLEPLGFVVREAIDGAAAVEELRTEAADLVFMDLVMPGVDGFGAIRAIRDDPELRDTVIVAISASVASSVRDECLDAGFNDFVAKPFRDTDLFGMMQRLLGLEWVHQREEPAPERPAEVVVPRAEELTELVAQTESGNIRGILDAVDDVAALDARYGPFAKKVATMAREFQINRLANYLGEVTSRSSRDE